MYKKATGILLLWGMVFFFGTICVDGVALDRRAAAVMDLKWQETVKAEETGNKGNVKKPGDVEATEYTEHDGSAENVSMQVSHSMGIVDKAISDQRVLPLRVVENTQAEEVWGSEKQTVFGTATLSEEDMDLLLRIVEAEAGDQDVEGRLLVANVVLNRVESDAFPNGVKEVIVQEQGGAYQFSPVANGRIWRVSVSARTTEAVERALDGEDISEGALYFVARQYADKSKVKWFDDHLTYLFEWGGHEFFK